MSARRRTGVQTTTAGAERPLVWPGDPDGATPADIDFEALAHVLANSCRFGGRTRQYHSLAAHAVVVSEEVEALDGLDPEDRRRLALHALLAPASAAWLRGAAVDSQRAVERASRLAAGIERAVREAAGLDPVLGEEEAELLRFVSRMTTAAERRDLADADAGPGAAFPPLRRRIRPVGPGPAARLWLARFRALSGPPRGTGVAAGDGSQATAHTEEETGDVAHSPRTEGMDEAAQNGEEADARQAA